jgi:hypothetical protein
MKFLRKVKSFILSPIKAFDESKIGTLMDAFKYFFCTLTFSAALFLTSAFLFPDTVQETSRYVTSKLSGFVPVSSFSYGAEYFIFLFLTIGIIYIFMAGIWLHLWVYVVGGRKGVDQTIKAMMYGFTPVLIAWIPIVFIQVIASIWMMFLTGIGIWQLHEIPTSRAIIACTIAYLGDLFYTFDAIRYSVG